jgi:hypothetical protein
MEWKGCTIKVEVQLPGSRRSDVQRCEVRIRLPSPDEVELPAFDTHIYFNTGNLP